MFFSWIEKTPLICQHLSAVNEMTKFSQTVPERNKVSQHVFDFWAPVCGGIILTYWERCPFTSRSSHLSSHDYNRETSHESLELLKQPTGCRNGLPPSLCLYQPPNPPFSLTAVLPLRPVIVNLPAVCVCFGPRDLRKSHFLRCQLKPFTAS